MAKKRKLGRGLDALLGGINKPGEGQEQESGQGQAASVQPQAVQKEALNHSNPVETPVSEPKVSQSSKPKEPSDGELTEIPVDLIQRGKYQPRRDMQPEALEELASSIRTQGVMQPIVVRPVGKTGDETQYEIIAGERRWRATQQAGLHTIPAIVRLVPDEAAIAMALIENIQREDLNAMEEAMALQRLKDEFELTHQEVAEAVGKSRATVTNLLRLMTLNESVQKMLENGDIEMGHARAILSLPENEQKTVAKEVSSKSYSVRQTEAYVRRLLQQKDAQSKQDGEANKIDPDTRHLQNTLTEKFGAPVLIQHNAKGKGKLVVSYNSLDELDGILSHIK